MQITRTRLKEEVQREETPPCDSCGTEDVVTKYVTRVNCIRANGKVGTDFDDAIDWSSSIRFAVDDKQTHGYDRDEALIKDGNLSLYQEEIGVHMCSSCLDVYEYSQEPEGVELDMDTVDPDKYVETEETVCDCCGSFVDDYERYRIEPKVDVWSEEGYLDGDIRDEDHFVGTLENIHTKSKKSFQNSHVEFDYRDEGYRDYCRSCLKDIGIRKEHNYFKTDRNAAGAEEDDESSGPIEKWERTSFPEAIMSFTDSGVMVFTGAVLLLTSGLSFITGNIPFGVGMITLFVMFILMRACYVWITIPGRDRKS